MHFITIISKSKASLIPSGILSAAGTLAYAISAGGAFLSVRRLLACLLLFVLLNLVLFFFFHKLIIPSLKQLALKAAILLVICNLLLSFYILTYLPLPLLNHQIFNRNLKVEILPSQTPGGILQPVVLKGLQMDGEFVSYGQLKLYGNWQKNADKTLLVDSTPAGFEWSGRVRESVLIFGSSPQGGSLIVNWDGQKTLYDLYAPAPDEPPFLVHVSHPVSPLENFILLLLWAPLLSLPELCLCCLLIRLSGPVKQTHGSIPAGFNIFIKNNLSHILLGLAGIGLMLFVTRTYGLMVITDSINYLSASRHLLEGKGYVAFNNDVYTWWPPLLPVILAFFRGGLTETDMFAIRFLYLLVFGLNLSLGSYLLKKVAHPALYLPAALLLLISIPLWATNTTLLSEPFFLLFEILLLIIWLRLIHEERVLDLLLDCLLLMALCQMRYVGVLMVAAFCLAYLFAGKGRLARRFIVSLLVGLISTLPLMIWVWHNLSTEGVLTGYRSAAQTTLLDNFFFALNMIGKWFLPFNHWGLGAIIILSTLGGVLYTCKQNRDGSPKSSPFTTNWRFIILTVNVSVFYLLGLSVVLSSIDIYAIDDHRLVAPAFMPLFILIVSAISGLIKENRPDKFSLAGRTLVWLCCLGLSISPLQSLVSKLTEAEIDNQFSFSMYSFWHDPLVNAIKEENNINIVSNCHRCIYYTTNIFPLGFFDSKAGRDNLKNHPLPLKLVWFSHILPGTPHPGEDYSMPPLQEALGQAAEIKLLQHTESGDIYLINPAP